MSSIPSLRIKQPHDTYRAETKPHHQTEKPYAEHSLLIQSFNHMKKLYNDPKTRSEVVLWLHGEDKHNIITPDAIMRKLGIDREEFISHFPIPPEK